MRNLRLTFLLLGLACGDRPGTGLTAASASASEASATGGSSTGDTTQPPTTAEPTSTAPTSAGTGEGASSSPSSSSSSTGAGPTSGSTGEICPNGQLGCPCDQGDTCADGLVCDAGVCEPAPVCGDGVPGPGEACDDGNQVGGDGCEDDCTLTPAAPPDPCGFPSDDGVWFEIDYSNAFTATGPDWTFSPTPGWGEPEWAPEGESWPEVWDIYQNVEVITDPIGKVAAIDGGGALQVMFGIGGLTYDHATACVQGRSYSVGSPVIFTVQNQLNKCGGEGMMAQDWMIHSAGVDLGTCILGDNEIQGLRIFPSGGSGALSLMRLRLTLHGAVY